MLPALTIPASSRCMTQRPRGPVPSFPRRCGPARPHFMPGGRTARALGPAETRHRVPGESPPPQRRLIASPCSPRCSAQRRDDRGRALDASPDPDRGADDARSRRAERRRQRGHHGAAVRDLRHRPAPAVGIGRVVAFRRRRTALTFRLRRPDLLRRLAVWASVVVRSWLRRSTRRRRHPACSPSTSPVRGVPPRTDPDPVRSGCADDYAHELVVDRPSSQDFVRSSPGPRSGRPPGRWRPLGAAARLRLRGPWRLVLTGSGHALLLTANDRYWAGGRRSRRSAGGQAAQRSTRSSGDPDYTSVAHRRVVDRV
jgi:hypothetical protein